MKTRHILQACHLLIAQLLVAPVPKRLGAVSTQSLHMMPLPCTCLRARLQVPRANLVLQGCCHGHVARLPTLSTRMYLKVVSRNSNSGYLVACRHDDQDNNSGTPLLEL